MKFESPVIVAERALLIAAINSCGLIASEAAITKADFLDSRIGLGWEIVLELLAEGAPVDFVSFIERMPGVGVAEWLINHQKNTPSSAGNASYYAEVVSAASRKRKAQAIISAAAESIDSGGDEAIDQAIRDLLSLSQAERRHECSLKEALKKAVDSTAAAIERNGALIGISSGVSRLDAALGGFHAGDLVVIGARPAMGKTGLLLNLATAPDEPVGIISSEQGAEQVGSRILAMHGQVALYRMRNGKVQNNELDRMFSASANLVGRKRLRINDKPGITIDELIRQARQWKFEHGIKALYVDYIQRIHPRYPKNPRHEQVADIVQSLKELARELDLPIVALAQVSRQVESRENKRPHMGDLAESAAIEKEADQVMTLYRDEVYSENTKDKGIMEINVEKNRHGPTGMVRVAWIGEYLKVANLEERDYVVGERV